MRLAFALFVLSALPAVAGKQFTPPEGCTSYLTVQARGCRVSNHYTCTADNPGDQWRADFDQEGIFFLSKIDSEAQWIESVDQFPTVVQTLDPGAADPASFSDLLGGRDSYDFELSRDNGEHTHVTGFDQLTGKSVVIDGISLKQTEYDYTETDDEGSLLRQARGYEYISTEWRMFFAGPSEWSEAGGEFVPVDGSPVQFIMPGEPGFGATEPLFECDAIMSSYPVPAMQKGQGDAADIAG
ncbi:MAG: hypothetical protein WCC57_07435 [Paracoccaceae bacterium]